MVIESKALEQRIRQAARNLGCSHIGFALAEELTREGSHLSSWLDAGFQAEMGYMHRTQQARLDPRLVLPGARSVISLAWNYWHPAHIEEPHARISRYAWGDDYHDLLTPRVHALCHLIEEGSPGSAARGYVDTGPVMDKVWAQRAGIGWIGKNGNLITREYGSWVFLGTILTTMAFDADEPHGNFCGRCRACLDACPTRAFPAPGVVDARRCLSYLTIEKKGDFSEEESALPFADWVFGCDICQEVCPWNRFARLTEERGFHPRDHARTLDPGELVTLSPEEFSRWFSKSPVTRAKREGLARNARIVLRQRESHDQ